MRRAIHWLWFSSSLLTALAITALAVTYSMFGDAAMTAVYEGKTTGFLSRVRISGTLPLAYYLERLDWFVTGAALLLVVVYLLFMISISPNFFRIARLKAQAAAGVSFVLGFGLLVLTLAVPLFFPALILIKLFFYWLALLLLGLSLRQTRAWGIGRLGATTLLTVLAGYVVYAFWGHQSQLIFVFDEDTFFEIMQTLFIFASGVLFLSRFARPTAGQSRNLWYLLFALAFLLYAGEEISWGQRIFGFATPESLDNIQGETTLHNLRGIDHNTVLNVLMAMWVLVIPLLHDFAPDFRRLLERLRFSIMPLTSVAAVCLGLVIYFIDPQNIYTDEIRELFFDLALIFFALDVFHGSRRNELDAEVADEARVFTVVRVGEVAKPDKNFGR